MMVFATVVTRSGLVSNPARQFQPSECAKEIDGFDIKAILFKVWRCHFKKLALGICRDYGLGVPPSITAAALGAAHEEGNDEAS